jgi:multimeric flavodoxin WrbA
MSETGTAPGDDLAAVRVLCVAGSPRRGGNSERLLDAFIRGVNNAGGLAEKIVAVDLGIAPCRGCNTCSSTGACVIKDRMYEVYDLIDEADAIVISSPVYFATVPAVLKALYDRCQPYWARIYVRGEARPARRPGGLLLVRGGGDPFGSSCAVAPTRSVLAVLGVQYEVELEVEGPDAVAAIDEHVDLLKRAEELGAEMVVKARDWRARRV